MNARAPGGATSASCEYVRQARLLLRETALLAAALAAILLGAAGVAVAASTVSGGAPWVIYEAR
jgi:hypothetical protein